MANQSDEITIIYNISKDEGAIKVFGSEFVKNNKAHCKIIYENNELELQKEFDTQKINKDKLEIKLKGVSKITNMSNMFSGCSALCSLPDFDKIDTVNVSSMTNLFNGCSSLKSLSDISKWNTSNVVNMDYMFCGCSSLSSLPDISKWNTSNVTNMDSMFY